MRRNDVLVDLVSDLEAGTGGARIINPAAFTPVPLVNGVPARIGNLERNSLRGQPFREFNLGLGKNFGITEGTRLQFRTEFFNLTNTPRFNLPDHNFDDVTNFGVLRSAQSFSNRQIQFGLRLEF